MLGLIVVSGLIVYLWLLFWITRHVYRRVIAGGYSRQKAILFGCTEFLIFYLPVFWDFIPLLAMQKYYCSKNGGVKIYQTASQWARENPDRAKNVWFYEWGKLPKATTDGFYIVGNRFGSRFFQVDVVPGWIRSYENQFVDIETGKVLASRKEYVSLKGPGRSGEIIDEYKFWLKIGGCEGMDVYWNVANEFRSLGVEK